MWLGIAGVVGSESGGNVLSGWEFKMITMRWEVDYKPKGSGKGDGRSAMSKLRKKEGN